MRQGSVRPFPEHVFDNQDKDIAQKRAEDKAGRVDDHIGHLAAPPVNVVLDVFIRVRYGCQEYNEVQEPGRQERADLDRERYKEAQAGEFGEMRQFPHPVMKQLVICRVQAELLHKLQEVLHDVHGHGIRDIGNHQGIPEDQPDVPADDDPYPEMPESFHTVSFPDMLLRISCPGIIPQTQNAWYNVPHAVKFGKDREKMEKFWNRERIQRVLMITAGTMLIAAAVEMFILPYNILSGGVAGLAVALSPFLHVNKTLIADFLVISMLLLGGAVLGKRFFLDTCLSSLLYPLFTWMFLTYLPPVVVEPLLASFYGGLIGGVGVGTVMRAGASTGGMDIPPLIINKLTGLKLSALVAVTDALTVLLGFAAYGFSEVLLGLISVMSSSWAISKILSYGEGAVSKSVQIISSEWEEIYRKIDERLERGATVLEGVGAYKKEKRTVLLCVVPEREYASLLKIIDETDPKAFVITTDATDMHGEGFTYGFRL